MEGGHVGIKVNDQVGKNFQTKKGVRQGAPLSPILFNIVVDILAIHIKRAKSKGQIEGVILHLVDNGLSILQYADDTILFMEHYLEKARNMKLLLSTFEELFDLKINFHKSDVFYFGEAKDYGSQYEQLFGCKKGSFPFKYLSIPMHYRKLNNKD
jgi:retron-type reverse transcriptase